MLGLTACDPQVYGSVGVSSGWSNYGSSSMRGSVSVSGRVCCWCCRSGEGSAEL